MRGILKREREDDNSFHYTEKNEDEDGESQEMETWEDNKGVGEEEGESGIEEGKRGVGEGRRAVWENLRFVAFDCPVPKEEVEFEKRFRKIVLENSLKAHPLIVSIPSLLRSSPFFFFFFPFVSLDHM